MIGRTATPSPGPCLESLAPQVDELVLVANPGGDPTTGCAADPQRDARSASRRTSTSGVAATSAPYVVVANSDTRPPTGCIAALREFADAHPRCGIVAPELRLPRRQPAAVAPELPDRPGTIVRRTPLRRLLKPQERQRSHYLLDEHPTEPVEADWLLGAFLFFRREMLDELGGFDEGYRLYGEDIDLAYRAAKAGWERWYVPEAVAVHHHQAVTDKRFLTRRTLWHWRGIARFVRKHPESLRRL